MPENPIIQEGGSGRRMGSIGRIITFRDGGNDFWVPASERLTAQKFVSKNGVYVAKDEGLFAFSKLTVNVYGGAPGTTEPTTPTGPYDVETPTGETPAEIPAIPGGPGSSISGIDPTDGQQYTATVNPDGTISTIRSPAGIRVVVPPDKLDYTEGDKIDYHGLVIELLDAQGNVFTDSNYPDGRIPWSETRHEPDQSKPYLNLNVDTPVETATGGGGAVKRYASDDGNVVAILVESTLEYHTFYGNGYTVELKQYVTTPFFVYRGQSACIVTGNTRVSDGRDFGGPAKFFITKYDGLLYAAAVEAASGASWSIGTWEAYSGTHAGEGYWAAYATSSATFTVGKFVREAFEDVIPAPESKIDPMEFDISGLSAEASAIPVQWQSPYDWNTYEAEFNIKVKPREGGGSEGGGGGGEGGGGGHGF